MTVPRRRLLWASAALLTGCSSEIADYCAFGSASTLMFIDETTPYDDTDRREIARLFAQVVERLGPGDRITVQTITDQYATSVAAFDGCKPGCPPRDFVSQYLGTGCSPVEAQDRLDEFMSRLITAIQPLLQGTAEKRFSDIIATLSRVTQAFPDRHFSDVVIYSDMIENAPDRLWPQFQNLSLEEMLSSVREAELIATLNGATVRILGFGRIHNPGRPQLPTTLDNKLRQFWRAYALESGASQVLFGALPGG